MVFKENFRGLLFTSMLLEAMIASSGWLKSGYGVVFAQVSIKAQWSNTRFGVTNSKSNVASAA